MKAPTCVVCKRKVNPQRPGADHLFNRPDDTEVWLCGRKACTDTYNGTDDEEEE